MSKKSKKEQGPLKVSLKKLKTNYEVRYNYSALLTEFIKTFPAEHRQTRVDNVVLPDGTTKEDWVRIVRDVQIGNLLVFLIDNGIEFNLENVTNAELQDIKKEYHERQDRIKRALKLKEESLVVTDEDYSFMKMPPYEYQKRAVKFFEINNGISILGDQPGVGKSLHVNSLISTPLGWKKMGDIQVGQEVFASDGKAHTVTGVYPQGSIPSYRVTFTDGYAVDCSMDHIWVVRDMNWRKRGRGWTTKTLKELVESGLQYPMSASREGTGRKLINKWEIPLTEPCQYPAADLVIAPYIMGALIGDGCMVGSGAAISIPDFQLQIKEEVEALLPSHMKLSKHNGQCPSYLLVNKEQQPNGNSYLREIRSIGLNVRSGEKFIPKKYMYGSVEQRIELLHGLMDTDGSCDKNRVNYHTTSHALARDVVELVQSLGGIAYIKEYDRSEEDKSTEYRVGIRTPMCPFKLESKAAQWNPSAQYLSRYIERVEYVGDAEQQCISVDSPDNTYLTEHYIVTHNTLSAISYAVKHQKKTLVICPASLKFMWKDEVAKFTSEKAHIFRYYPSKRTKEINHSKEESLFHVVNYEGIAPFIRLEYEHTCDGNKMDAKSKAFRKCGAKILSLTKSHKECPNCGGTKFKSRIHGVQYFKTKEDEIMDPDHYELIVIDEFHRMKNPKTDWTQVIKRAFGSIPEKLLLSGTAIKSRPIELFAPLNFLDPNTWNNRHEFGKRYCAAFEDHFGWVYDGVSNTEELYTRMAPLYLRRLKKDILPELPPKTYTQIRLELEPDELKEFTKLETATKKVKQQEGDVISEKEIPKGFMEKVHQIKLLTETIKLERASEFIQDMIAAKDKVVIFFDYLPTAQRILDLFGKNAVVHTGSMKDADKHDAVKRFQNDKSVNVFGGTIMSAGVGITLTAANKLIFIGQAWTPADMEQAEDRIHRASTTHDNVQIITYLCNDTWDNDIHEFLTKKDQVVSKVLDNVDSKKKITSYEGSLAHMLYNKLKA